MLSINELKEKIYYYIDILKTERNKIYIENIFIEGDLIIVVYHANRIPVKLTTELSEFYDRSFIYLNERHKCIIYKLFYMDSALKRLVEEEKLDNKHYKSIIESEIINDFH
ncbi:MAG: hypothetical protein ACH344_03070 [Yersinia sp. (in: enterobacteria)]